MNEEVNNLLKNFIFRSSKHGFEFDHFALIDVKKP